jgi:AcrR family transcriptional regulator
MDGITARAGTSKPVLYRRWPSRAELIVTAMRQRVGSILDTVPDTGTLRNDVLALLRHVSDRYCDLGPEVLHGLMGELDELLAPFKVMREAMMTILRRAAARGEGRLDKVTASHRCRRTWCGTSCW